MKKIINLLLIFLGFIALVLGTLGIVIPVLPTTPFYLLTCFCFTKGSARFHNWFLSTKLYKNHLDNFIKTRAMTLRMKLRLCIPASIFMIISFVLVPSWIAQITIICAFIFVWFYFIFRINTLPKR